MQQPFFPASGGAAGEGSAFTPSSPLPLIKELLPGILFPRPLAEISHFKIITTIGLKMPSNCVGSVLCKVVQLDGARLGLEQQRHPHGDAVVGRSLPEQQPPRPASEQRQGSDGGGARLLPPNVGTYLLASSIFFLKG